MSYLEFHLIFILPALTAAGLAARGGHRPLGVRAVWSLSLLAVLALTWTTPWDNYLVARGIWEYGPERVLGTIGWVPIEEYVFFVLQPVLTGLLLFALIKRRAPADVAVRPGIRLAGTLAWIVVVIVGWLALRTPAGTYLGLILVWAAPVAALQWGWDDRAIRRRMPEVVTAIAGATLYLCVADAIAIRSGIWAIKRATSTGITIAGLPVEEAVFFLLTNVLIVQGLVLFLDRGETAAAS